MNKKLSSADEYIQSFPDNIQKILNEFRQIIRKEAPDSEESIAYGMPAFKLSGKPLVYFAAFKKHIGFYPLPSSIETFKSELNKYKFSKGSIQFQLDEPIPYDLVRKIVRFRAQLEK